MGTEDWPITCSLDMTWAYFTGEGKMLDRPSSNQKPKRVVDTRENPGNSRLGYLQQKTNKTRRIRSNGSVPGSHSYSFVQAMRLIDCRFNLYNSSNTNIEYSSAPVLLAQPSRFTLSPSMVGDIVNVGESQFQMECNFLGLFGNTGPMPDYVSELVRSIELETEGNPSNEQMVFVDFLNLFNHKMLTLFYQAWTLAEPSVKRFTERDPYVIAVDGIGGNGPDTYGAVNSPVRRRLPYLFSGGRPTRGGLEAVISAALIPTKTLGCLWLVDNNPTSPVQSCVVHENQPLWLETPDDIRANLGLGNGGSGLGGGVYLGSRLLNVENCIAIKLSVAGLDAYRRLLPGGDWYLLLREVVQEYVGWDLTVKLWLEVDKATASGHYSELRDDGYCSLGQSTWLSSGVGAAKSSQRTVKFELIA